MPNRLAGEASPYLRQHADNPVDWYPWGTEALDSATSQNRPILLSIGYAACHWCHVMAHESFDDPATARLMNELFVNVKVDREERPDLDAIYMQAVQAMTGHGGWPMTVFLTPAGEPFWGGTYFPPDDRHGLPSFRRVLQAVANAYRTRPEQVAQTVATLRELYASTSAAPSAGELTASVLERAQAAVSQTYDARSGGFGDAPKFPPTMVLEFLLTQWARTGNADALRMARETFLRMAEGGIHDHVGGGFHRYAVDARWLVPHFEKMLYDNALLARLGAHLWQATGDPVVRETTNGILTWVAREMTSPEGGFFASLDADSEGHEGLFYTWTSDELRTVLGDEAQHVADWYGASPSGNFEGRNILHSRRDANLAPDAVARAIPRLYDARSVRVWPALDDKIIASWNGLMLRGIATCARVFGDASLRDLAVRNADFLASRLVSGNQVFRIWAQESARISGFLEDYAAVALGFLDVWQLTHERKWLDRAQTLGEAIHDRFWDASLPGFHDVPHDHEPLITRPRSIHDNATPAGSSLAIELFQWLGYVTGVPAYTETAAAALAPATELLARHPHGFGHALGCADFAVHGPTSIIVVGSGAASESLLKAASAQFLPASLVVASPAKLPDDLPIFAGRDPRGGPAAAYFCQGHTCDAPVTTADALSLQLASAFPAS